MKSSPASDSTMNSCDWLPPIAPECASTTRYSKPAALEDPAIGVVVLLVGDIQPGRVHVERVRVLHDELPHAQQSRLRPRLIAKLGLDLIPDLRQLFIAAQFAARDRWS